MKKLVIILSFAFNFVANAQMTFVPDDNFEQALIDIGLDTPPLNDSIPTKNIDTVLRLSVSSSSINDLTGIEDFKSLEFLGCSYNSISKLDVSNNYYLKELHCTSAQLTELNVNKNPYLIELQCNSNLLKNLDISSSPLLEILGMSFNFITGLDASKNIKLTHLDCSSNRLTYLNIQNGNDNNLGYLDARFNSNLICIQVDDTTFAKNNTIWLKSISAHYSIDCNSTGLNEQIEYLSLSPNPASDYIEISGSRVILSEVKNLGVSIYDMLGVEVYCSITTPPAPSQEGGKYRIDISGLSPGVYFVRVGDVVRKFVKM
jgi:hypothetical protein